MSQFKICCDGRREGFDRDGLAVGCRQVDNQERGAYRITIEKVFVVKCDGREKGRVGSGKKTSDGICEGLLRLEGLDVSIRCPSLLRVGSNFKATSRLSGSRLRLQGWRTRLPGGRIDS